jgi:hypothetical protein
MSIPASASTRRAVGIVVARRAAEIAGVCRRPVHSACPAARDSESRPWREIIQKLQVRRHDGMVSSTVRRCVGQPGAQSGCSTRKPHDAIPLGLIEQEERHPTERGCPRW